MAEAHNVAALSLHVTHDGVSLSYDQELLRDIWHTFSHAYKRRIARFKNDFRAGTFPASPYSLLLSTTFIVLLYLMRLDLTLGTTSVLRHYLFYFVFGDGYISHMLALFIASTFVWFVGIQLLRVSLKFMLSYKGWMYESPYAGKISNTSRYWLTALHMISRCEPLMHSFQGALPHLPLPSLKDTRDRHLLSMRPITTDKEYEELVSMWDEFIRTVGPRLQRYLIVKSWLSVNYVTDWWEEFVYLRSRSPIMINSNYYGLDSFCPRASQKPAARAANCTYAALMFRRMIDRRTEIRLQFSVSPRFKVPFCTVQYERVFNTTRIPGEEVDSLQYTRDSRHIAVLCRGSWYRVRIHNGKRLANACELQTAFQAILDMTSEATEHERMLPVLTAGERTHWARARKDFFSRGVNKTSLHTIEKAAFVVVLEDETPEYDERCVQQGVCVSDNENDYKKLDSWACLALHGDGYSRWFDKSFNITVSANARVYFNVEHSWGDAAISAHLFEYILYMDNKMGYDPNDDCHGEANGKLDVTRLRWELNEECVEAMQKSAKVARALIDDVEMALLPWNEFGKGFIKKTKMSPDAFLQMALQLTYRRNQNRFCLTYEASMTRLFREGRTETVRSCTVESCAFVEAMLGKDATREERVELLRVACDRHQNLYRDAMCGKGSDRHIFALYVVMRYLEEKSPLMEKIMPPDYELSTSQTPLQQTEGVNLLKAPWIASAGGGFGPVSERGYGVSYIAVGEDLITFHISSKRSADNTSSAGFRRDLIKSLREMRALFTNMHSGEQVMTDGTNLLRPVESEAMFSPTRASTTDIQNA